MTQDKINSVASVDVRIEHLRDTLGIGTDRPRLSWIVETETQGWLQTGYEVEAYGVDGQLRNQTGRVEADQSVLVSWPFAPLTSRERVSVRARARARGICRGSLGRRPHGGRRTHDGRSDP